MIPTPKLRWINRPIPNFSLRVERVLQQWWEQDNSINMGWGDIPINTPKGEWRDVPIEKETE
jgi:hypothetical protein